ncbi:DUF3267 domain-containing protein [Camelliibacillus cellulosilyticus]
MNCWKSFNVSKDLGSVRLVIFSLLGMLCFFILFNLLFTETYTHLKVRLLNFGIMIICILLVLPIHKLLHCLPIWLTGRKARLSIEKASALPMIHCNIKGAVSKRIYMVATISPAIIGTILMIAMAYVTPSAINYFAVSGSINFGLSVSDFLYLSYLLSAPSHAIVEEDRDGCRILIKQSV